ncbi:MAG: RNA polymerase sigma factor [Acidimicrobiales bacterium]
MAERADDLDAARRGDPRAFGRLLRAWDADLRGVAWSVVRNADAVDDVCQSAYEKAFRQIDGFAGDSSMKTWLHSIVYRTAIDHTRRETLRRHESLDAVAATPGPASTSDSALDHLEVVDAFGRLDPETRAMVMLTGVAGLSFDEVAEIIGVARGTVASRVSRARTRLRQEALS